jgi:exodeoxyribonuclease-3
LKRAAAVSREVGREQLVAPRRVFRFMRLTLTTWNINSVRLRIDLVAKFIKAKRPDVLCLQETKCPDDKFPLKRFKRLGYEHVALNGQKGYHGVAIVSRVPLETTASLTLGGKPDSRHIAAVFG